MTVELIKEDRRKLLVIMEEIVRRCELEALAVVTQSNAEEIAFFADMDTNVDIFCALAAASLDTATKVTNKMNHGNVLELVVIGDKGFTIMSPVSDQYILIGAGRDFYSLGKTILILREKVKEIPLTLTDKRPTTTHRKACSHFCQFDELYCCVCSNLKTRFCELCQNSIQQKQAEQKRLLEGALEKAKQMEKEADTLEANLTFAFTPDIGQSKSASLDGQNLFNKVMNRITTMEGEKPEQESSLDISIEHQLIVNPKKTPKQNISRNRSKKKAQQVKTTKKKGKQITTSKKTANKYSKKSSKAKKIAKRRNK